MMMLNCGWGRRVWLSGTVACVVSLGCSAIAQAGIIGGDNKLSVRTNGIIGGDLEVLGVVETSEPASATVTVLGQTVRLTADTRVTSESGAALAKGALVAVYGKINTDGTITASQVSVQANEYVAGATSLYVRGVVKSVNASLARATVGGLSVDFSSSLAGGNSSISVGSVAEFSGLQTSSSTLYASKSTALAPAGIIGGDKAVSNGIIGGDRVVANGIIGGDLKAQVVSNGIIGGDKFVSAGIIGGDKIVSNGIIGGDRVVANGIIGGDLKAQVVSNGIIGGDKFVSAGIIGGDRVVANGIIGGDKVVSNGIIGGDLKTQVTTNGIIGGDKLVANGIIGGDLKTQVTTNGIIGGDKLTTNGIIGGDKLVTNGIIGGDRVVANGIIGGDKL